ncbi:MAG: hypothetical protein NTY67_05695 [Cyanobacteria bacterium]|nr:hypothetical protein [Cyanobacteriota bacterium]
MKADHGNGHEPIRPLHQHQPPLNQLPEAGGRRTGAARLLGRLTLAAALLSLAGCVPAAQRASGWVYPLHRHQPNDGLAVVNRPGGAGLHLWLDTDTSEPGRCSPRWNPDAARLRAGNGPRPSSTGRASRQEFYDAMALGPVRWQLRRQFAALCRQRAPGSRFVWLEPPRRAEDYRPAPYPMVEGRNLLSNPKAVLRAEKRLLGQPIAPEDFENEEPPPVPPGP